jgi:ABC-type branched-subunit amino acid transport system ATPase component
VTPLLSADDVTVRFGGLRALDGVSMAAEDGEIVGLIGPNGAGKTTLFNVVSGLQEATSGTVTFGGRDVSSAPAHARARLGIRRSFQNLGVMLDQTVETNVLAGQHLDVGYRPMDPVVRPLRWWRQERRVRAAVDEALAELALAGHRRELVRDLSFGVARFVELASLLVSSPRMLLLDEPTTGLDLGESRRLAQALAQVRQRGTTIVVVAHDVSFVMSLCDRVYVLAGGRMLFEGRPADARADPAVVQAYLGAAG